MGRKPTKKRRKDGRYCVRVGSVPFYSYESWADANRQAQSYRRELEQGLAFDARRTTIKEYALRWLPLHKANVKDKTYNEYAGLINKLLPFIGDYTLIQLTPDDALEAFQKAFPPAKYVGDDDGYSGSTIKRAKMLYRDLFDTAIENGYAMKNPFRSSKFKPAMGKDGTHREITDEERKLIHEVHDRFRLPVMMMLYAGLRKGEVLAINLDTDVADGYIHVGRAVTHPINQPHVGNTKTENAIRKVPIFPPLASELENAHGLIAPAIKSGDIMSGSAFRRCWESYILSVECHMNGVKQKRWYGLTKEAKEADPEKYLAIRSLMDQGKKEEADELRLSGWKQFTVRPHDLRHSFCTMCCDAGVNIKQTIEWMGHADEKMILKIYDHVTSRRSQESIQKVEKFLAYCDDSGQNSRQKKK